MKNNRLYGKEDFSAMSPEEREKKAYIKAVDLLYRQPQTEASLRRKLGRTGFDEEIIDKVTGRLKEERFLNDLELCIRSWELYLQKRENSLREIRYKLMNKGFGKSDIAMAEEEVRDEYRDYEYTACRNLLNRKARNIQDDGQKLKLLGYLARKGFDGSTARYALEDFLSEQEN